MSQTSENYLINHGDLKTAVEIFHEHNIQQDLIVEQRSKINELESINSLLKDNEVNQEEILKNLESKALYIQKTADLNAEEYKKEIKRIKTRNKRIILLQTGVIVVLLLASIAS